MKKDTVSKNMAVHMQRKSVVFICALLCCFLWGSAFPCIKTGYRLFFIAADDSASQLVFAGIRFTLAGILTVTAGSCMQRKLLIPSKQSLLPILKLCLAQTVVQYFFFYIGLANTSGVKSSIIEGANVFLSVLIAAFVFKLEKFTVWKALGCLLGFSGVVLINLSGSEGIDWNMSFKGEGFILISTVAYAFSSAMIKRYSRKENPVTLSGYQFLAGGLVLLAAGLLMGGRISFAGVGAGAILLLIYMAVISAAAYSVWGILLKYNPVGKVAVYGFMNPVFGVLLSAWMLGESSQAFGVAGVVALALVCAGIWVVNSRTD